MSIKSLFEDIADAIREKSGSSDTYTPAEMPSAIRSIPSGSSTASGVSYDNTSSGLTASNVQDAIDELSGDLSTINSDLSELSPRILASNSSDGVKTYAQVTQALYSVLEALSDEELKQNIYLDRQLTSGSNTYHYYFSLTRYQRGDNPNYNFSRMQITTGQITFEEYDIRSTVANCKSWTSNITTSQTTLTETSNSVVAVNNTFSIMVK